MINLRALNWGLMLIILATTAIANAASDDLLDSPQWETMHKVLLKGEDYVFDNDKVRVMLPQSAHDSLQVPVFIDVSKVSNIEKIVIFADLNPIPKIMEFIPKTEAPTKLSFYFKVQQSTPVRAAVLTKNGKWLVGSAWLDAVGGGCTLPSFGSENESWSNYLGNVRAKVWRNSGYDRVKFSIMHPMDTGLVSSIPSFHVSEIDINSGSGEKLAQLKIYEPISENPVFTVQIKSGSSKINISGRDNHGNLFNGDYEY